MRVTTAFSRLLRLPGVWVRKVRFEPDRVVVEVALRRRLLVCPECGYSTRARKDKRPVDSVWRHLDLGIWRLEVRCRRRRLWCSVHGARTESVPVRPAGLGVHTRLRMPGRVAGDAHRQVDDQADAADRLGHGRADRQARLRRRARFRPPGRSLRHRRGRGQLEAPTQVPHTRGRPSALPGGVGMRGVRPSRRGRVLCPARPAEGRDVRARQAAWRGARAGDHGPVRPVPDGPRRPRHPGRVAAARRRDRARDLRARRAAARRLDGHRSRVRQVGPRARSPGDRVHRPLSRRAARQPGARRGPPRLLERRCRSLGDQDAAKRFKDSRWSLLKKPEKLTDKQATTLARIKTAGGEVWRAYTLKEAVRGIFEPASRSRTSRC